MNIARLLEITNLTYIMMVFEALLLHLDGQKNQRKFALEIFHEFLLRFIRNRVHLILSWRKIRPPNKVHDTVSVFVSDYLL